MLCSGLVRITVYILVLKSLSEDSYYGFADYCDDFQ